MVACARTLGRAIATCTRRWPGGCPCAQFDESRTVSGVLDLELGGRWLRVTATLAAAEPEVGLPVPHALEVSAVDEDGVVVELETEEVAELKGHFERGFYRWRERGVYKN